MKELAVYEAKTRLSELLVEVEQGAQFVITRRGVPVARLVSAALPEAQRARSIAQRTQRQRVRADFEDLERLRGGVQLGSPLREAVEHGRD